MIGCVLVLFTVRQSGVRRLNLKGHGDTCDVRKESKGREWGKSRQRRLTTIYITPKNAFDLSMSKLGALFEKSCFGKSPDSPLFNYSLE